MSQQQMVRVVVGEASEPHPGPVRWALDVEGFDVVGQGSNRAELERVLAGVEPTVIVVDDAIPVSALMALHAKVPAAGIVVVWPASVSSKAIADAHVDPGCIHEDLGHAVRRAARRRMPAVYDPPVAIGEPLLILPDAEPEPVPPAVPVATPIGSAVPRRSARVLVGAAAVMALVVMMVGVSFALDASRQPDPAAGTSTTRSPVPSSPPTLANTAPAPSAAASTAGGRAACGPRVDPGSKAADQSRSGTNGDNGTRSHGSNCGGVNNGAGATNAHGAATGNGTTTTGHGQAGTHTGQQQHPTQPDPTTAGDTGGSSNGRSRPDEPGRSNPHTSGGATGHSTGH